MYNFHYILHIYDFLNDVVSYCCDDTYDLVAAECFKYEIIPVISECDYRDILDTIEEWTEKLDEQIEEVERYSEKYQYTRRYSWRQNCADGSEWDVYPEEYETEQEYNAALLEAKYEWRAEIANLYRLFQFSCNYSQFAHK